MGLRKLQDVRVASVDGSQASGPAIHVGGKAVTVGMRGPASLGLVQGSNDGANWVTSTSRVDGSTALSSLATNTHNEVYERTKYIRCAVASDGSAVRNFDFQVHVYDEE